jgi:hypothetical protein
MNETVSRRVFVGSVAAGLPLMVSNSSGSITALPADTGHRHVADQEPDVMFDHTIRRMAAITNKLRVHGAAPEDVRLAAAHLGTLAIYTQQSGLDVRVAIAMRDLARAQSDGQALELDIDRSRMRAALKRYGVDFDERSFNIPRPDAKAQERAIDALFSQGLTGMFTRNASMMERAAVALDRRRGGATGIRLVQLDDWRLQVCPQLMNDIVRLSAEAAAACAATIFIPQIDAACVMAEMSLLVMLQIYAALCSF